MNRDAEQEKKIIDMTMERHKAINAKKSKFFKYGFTGFGILILLVLASIIYFDPNISLGLPQLLLAIPGLVIIGIGLYMPKVYEKHGEDKQIKKIYETYDKSQY